MNFNVLKIKRLRLSKLFILLAFMAPASLPGQIQSVNIGSSSGASFAGAFQITGSKAEEAIVGTPYLSDVWQFGYMLTRDSTLIQGLFRYNSLDQSLELIYNSDTLGLSKPFDIEYFEFNNRKFIYALCLDREMGNDLVYSSYFEVLSFGTMELLKKHTVDIENNSYSTSYMGGGGDGRDYYIHKSFLYVRKGEGSAAFKLKKKKKHLLSLFEDQQDEVLRFIKNEDLNLKKEKDLVRLFDHYNAIVHASK